MIPTINILPEQTHGSGLEVSMQGSVPVMMDHGQSGARRGVRMGVEYSRACGWNEDESEGRGLP